MNKLLIICGPTAIGKTALAVKLAKQFNGELISADSRQIYQGLDILSGKDITPGVKPTMQRTVRLKNKKYPIVTYEMDGVPLWLYDVAPAHEPLSISHFHHLASLVIADISKRRKLPIVIGGTGYYLSSLVGTIDTLDIPQNAALRDALGTKTVHELQNDLAATDVVRWSAMNVSDRQNPRRLVRALEIAAWKKDHTQLDVHVHIKYDTLWIGLRADLQVLRERIGERTRQRVRSGAVEEVKKLRSRISQEHPSSTTLGLVPLQSYVDKKISLDEAIIQWTTQEISYAKRQMTWFKKHKEIQWLDITKSSWVRAVTQKVASWYTTKASS